MGTSVVFLLVLFFPCAAFAVTGCSTYTQGTAFSIDWCMDDTTQEITVTLYATTTGYISLGVFGTGTHVADTWTVWVDGAGGGHAIDGRMAGGRNQPVQDAVQNLVYLSSSFTGGVTSVTFSRPYNTGDANDAIITTGNCDIQWGLRNNDPTETAPGTNVWTYQQHTTRGRRATGFSFAITAPTSSTSATNTGTTSSTSSSSSSSSSTSGTETSATEGPPTGNSGCSTYTAETFVTIDWCLDPATQVIQVTLSGPTTGYISVGVFGTGAHEATDTWVVWYANGVGYALDAYMNSPPKTQPVEDAQQDLTVIDASEVNGVTSVTFTRPYNTGDANDAAITIDTQYFQWAIQGADPTGAAGSYSYEYHDERGEVQQFTFATDAEIESPSSESPGAALGAYENEDGTFRATFVVDEEAATITFTVWAATTGWISFGWSDAVENAHVNTDMYTGWVDSSGTAVVLDTWSTTTSRPGLDTEQGGSDDVIADSVSGEEADGGTTLVWSRALDTGDSYDAIVVKTDVQIQWAFGGAADEGVNYNIHEDAGVGTANFYAGASGPRFLSNLDAGSMSVITLASFLVAWAIIRWANKLYKHFFKRIPMAEVEAGQTTPSRLDTSTYGGGYNENNFGTAATTNKRSSVYFRGSEAVVTSGVDEYDASYDYNNGASSQSAAYMPPSYAGSSSSYTPAAAPLAANSDEKVVKAKGKSNCCMRAFHSCRHTRIPYSQISLIDASIGLIYALMNIFWWVYFAWPNPGNANIAGQLAAANCLVVAMPATRNSFLVWVLGLPFDRTIMFHRWLGRWVLILSTIHMFQYWNVWVVAKTFGPEFVRTGFGTLSWFFFLLVFVSSISWVRRRHFEIFFWSHFMFLLCYLFGALHVTAFRPYAYVAAGFYVLDRCIRGFWGLYPRKTTTLRVKEGGVVQVRFPKHPLAVHKAGQYVFINFPGLAFFEWHPYTLSSSPAEADCEVHIKSLGDHTTKLLERAKAGGYLWARIDGPYGKLSLNYKRYPAVVLMAGGVGITPSISLAKLIYDINSKTPVAPPPHVKQVHFVWVCPNLEVYGWFSDVMDLIYAKAGKNGWPTFYLQVFLTKATTVPDPSFQKAGRPDMNVVFHDISAIIGEGRAACYACGPSQLVNESWDQCMATSLRKRVRFDFHHETFDF